MAFHDEADEAFALVVGLGEKLLGGGADGFVIATHFDLRHGFHGDRDTLFGIEILLRRHVERHELQGKFFIGFNHRHNYRAAANDGAGAAQAIYNQRLMRSRLAKERSDGDH